MYVMAKEGIQEQYAQNYDAKKGSEQSPKVEVLSAIHLSASLTVGFLGLAPRGDEPRNKYE